MKLILQFCLNIVANTYTKEHIVMDKTDERISSLTEYINIIKKYDLRNQYFRGENQKYPNISSSLIRGYVSKGQILGLVDIYSNLLREYYQEVGYELDKMQEENFLAFSQHHGLKTNLIDFTTAPLVALYFACEREKYDVDSGFVYILNEEDTIDASKFLQEYSIKEHLCHNVFSQLAWNEPDIVNGFRTLLEKYTGLFSGKNPYDLVKDMAKQIQNYPQFEKCNSYLKEREILCKKGIDGISEIPQLVKKYLPNFDILGGMGIMEFTALFLLFFDDMRCLPSKLPSDIPFPNIPYFMYKTPLKFDRIRNQSGVFLYQAFIDYQTDLDEMGGLMVQKITPSMVIQVDNQKEIMKELDMVGINKKYIYGDFDNTAQYINMKFFGN